MLFETSLGNSDVDFEFCLLFSNCKWDPQTPYPKFYFKKANTNWRLSESPMHKLINSALEAHHAACNVVKLMKQEASTSKHYSKKLIKICWFFVDTVKSSSTLYWQKSSEEIVYTVCFRLGNGLLTKCWWSRLSILGGVVERGCMPEDMADEVRARSPGDSPPGVREKRA